MGFRKAFNIIMQTAEKKFFGFVEYLQIKNQLLEKPYRLLIVVNKFLQKNEINQRLNGIQNIVSF